jgi:hypothetical protein
MIPFQDEALLVPVRDQKMIVQGKFASTALSVLKKFGRTTW